MLGTLLDADRVEGDSDAAGLAVVVNLFDDNLNQADLIAKRHRFPDWIEGDHRGLDVLLGTLSLQALSERLRTDKSSGSS